MGTNGGGGSYDQVVPNDPHNPTPSPPHIINCASEVEITSSNEVVQTQAHVNFETPTGPVTVFDRIQILLKGINLLKKTFVLIRSEPS